VHEISQHSRSAESHSPRATSAGNRGHTIYNPCPRVRYSGEGENIGEYGIARISMIILLFWFFDTLSKVLCTSTGLFCPACPNTLPLPLVLVHTVLSGTSTRDKGETLGRLGVVDVLAKKQNRRPFRPLCDLAFYSNSPHPTTNPTNTPSGTKWS